MSDATVESAIKQLVLANADGEIRSLVIIMIDHNNEPEMELAMAPGTGYAVVSALEILKMHVINKLVNEGARKPKERE